MQSRRPTPVYRAWMLPSATLALMAGILLGRGMANWHGALAGLGMGLCAALAGKRHCRLAGVAACAACLGMLLGWFGYHPALPVESTAFIRGTVVQNPEVREDGQVQTVLADVTLNGEPVQGDVYWTYYLQSKADEKHIPSPGAAVAFTGSVYHPQGPSNPGGFDFRQYLRQRGVRVGVFGAENLAQLAERTLIGRIAAIRHRITSALLDVMGPEYGAYAATMLLGDQALISDNDADAFRALGIAHILSVSGYHVGVLTALIALLMRPLPMRRLGRIAVYAAVLPVYCLLAGGQAPIIRAALMLLWRETGMQRKQRVSPLHILCAAACLQLLFNPAQLFSASFQLSYAAMLGLMVVRPGLASLCKPSAVWRRRVWQAFCAALGAQIGILLPQLYWFGDLPLLSLPINMVVTGFSGVLMASYWLVLAVLPVPLLREAAGGIASALTGVLISAVRAFADMELGSLWTRQADVVTLMSWVMLVAGLGGFVTQKLRRFCRLPVMLGSALMLTILIPLPHTGVRYMQFDVGDADAALLQAGDVTVAIDLGEDGAAVANYLHDRRQEIDILILTHLHIDHAGGLRAILDEGIPVDACFIPVDSRLGRADEKVLRLLDELAEAGTQMHTLRRGDSILLPSGSITAMWPAEGFTQPEQPANETSLALLANIRGVSMLLTGDLHGRYERYVQRPVDILKVAHHGSRDSTSPAFLDEADADVLLLSNAASSRLERMQALQGDALLLDTARYGCITIHFLGNGEYEVETCLEMESVDK